ncbi:MAG TPA: hypothetical protein DHV36_11860, partial [Desulfobacteraceae bacterium]|nr:hypothetical protein [Desulfobacteraceae bacterium]
ILPVPDTDWRTKNDRSRIRVGAGKRKYHLSHSFLDRIVIDFMDGSIDGAYIKKLRFQPSILPFYDGRLLTILKGLDPDTAYVKMEMAKYWAVSQILFTSEDAYLYIATNAVERNERVRGICDRVLEKIRKNRDTLKEEMVQDQDWLRFCAVFDYYIKERITAAWHLMIHKKDGRRYSDRYGGGRTIDPIDRESLREAKRLGDEYQKVLQLTDTYLTELRDTIESYAWMTKRGGGTTITMKGRRRKVPATVALIYDHLLISGRCEVRLIRAVASIADILVKSLARTRRHTRHSTTTEAYKSFRTKIRTLGRGMRECGCSEEAVGLIHPELLKG